MIRNAFLLLAVVSVSILASCGGDGTDEPTETQKDKIVAALTGTWTINVASSNVTNVTGSPSLDGLAVSFNATGFSLSGSIAEYVNGGAYTISDEGVFTVGGANAVGDRSATLTSVAINADLTQVTVVIEVTEANGRVGGLGTYTLVFTKSA